MFIGNGISKSKSVLQSFPNAVYADDYQLSARSLSEMAYSRFLNADFVDLAYHVPFYLKEANVTESKKKAL